MDIPGIQEALKQFAEARDWGKFHSPKNLAIALAVEASELLEHFQWLSDDESRSLADRPEDHAAVADELADVMIYLIQLAGRLNVDLERAVADKMRKNAAKYPVALARGNAVKYNRRAPTDGA